MSEENKLFLPLFYNTLEITDSLSNEDFGILVRELLRSRGSREYSANLPKNLILAYNFMLDNAIRIFSLNFKRGNQKSYKEGTAKAPQERSFDPEEAFKKALARSYSKDASQN